MATILMYTTGRKPFVQRFYDVHLAQAAQLNFGFACISTIVWDASNDKLTEQRPLLCEFPYAGILEAILQGLEEIDDDEIVFLAEDDCLYLDARYAQQQIDVATTESDRMFYQANISFIAPQGFYQPKINGVCLHSAFGTAKSIRHNIANKLAEFRGERDFPASSVEPVSYPSPENPNPANAIYRTRMVGSEHSLSLDFRGYGEQTWKPDGSEQSWQDDKIWGNAQGIWNAMIEMEPAGV